MLAVAVLALAFLLVDELVVVVADFASALAIFLEVADFSGAPFAGFTGVLLTGFALVAFTGLTEVAFTGLTVVAFTGFIDVVFAGFIDVALRAGVACVVAVGAWDAAAGPCVAVVP